jgi:hypothetical protein
MKPELVLVLSLCAGCNSLAGIADYHTVDAFDDGGPADAADDAGDAGSDAATLPTCTGADVPLRIDVIESKSQAFTGISDAKGHFSMLAVGDTYQACVPPQVTLLDLRAEPNDPSDGMHDWGDCGTGRRCVMTVVAATLLEVHLQ